MQLENVFHPIRDELVELQVSITNHSYEALDWLFEQVLKHPVLVIGFDSEARPQYEKGKGENPNALVQLAIEKEVLLYHCHEDLYYGDFTFLVELTRLFAREGVTVAGMNVVQDVKKIFSDIRQTFNKRDFQNVIELKKFALSKQISIRGGLQGHGVHLCDAADWKNRKITMSNWELWPLSFDQIRYAAIDAYMSLLVYEALVNIDEGSSQLFSEESLASSELTAGAGDVVAEDGTLS